MRIGIDLDGVVFNTENAFRAGAELFDLKINGGGIVNKDELKVSKRYNWPTERKFQYIDEYLIDIERTAALLPYAKEVLDKLREEGHEIYVVTSRGTFQDEKLNNQEIETSKYRFEKDDLKFDKVIFGVNDKLQACLDEKIELMVEDSFKYVDAISKAGIPVLYFRAIRMKKCNNSFVTEVENWGEVYHYIKLKNYNF